MSKTRYGWSTLVLLTSLLTACQGAVQEAFGLKKRAPDEFQVVRGRPLVVPKEKTLPPPKPGVTGPAEVAPAVEARAVLLGRSSDQPASAPSPGEAALLRAAKGPLDPDIRRRLAEEDGQLAVLDERTFLFIFDWQRRQMQQRQRSGEPLDPVAEARRLQAEGRVQTIRRATEAGG